MKILAFAASHRADSLNRKLVALAAEAARKEGADVDLADFNEFHVPHYNGDHERGAGLPEGALELKRRLERANAVLLASPEYNYSIPGALKNAIDWVSRARPMPWRGKSIYLMSASPSPMGGIRGLWQTRIPLEGCGALVFPDMFALPNADQAFDDTGQLRDRKLAERLEQEVRGFVRLADAIAPVCDRPRTAAEKQRRETIVSALEKESQLQPTPAAAKKT